MHYVSYLLKSFSEVQEILFSIPGVVKIGIGHKEKNGRVILEYVYRVYVKNKRKIDNIPIHEVIPSIVFGIKTDVLVADKAVSESKTTLTPGLKISRYVPGSMGGSGTIGCLVTKNSKNYILTNNHVLNSHQQFITEYKQVYQPQYCDVSGIQCRGSVAEVVIGEERKRHTFDGKVYWVDADLAEVKAGIHCNNTIDGIGPVHHDIRDLATESIGAANSPENTIIVKKRGATTGLTEGQIIELCHIVPDGILLWELKARATNAYHYSETFEISTEEPSSLDEIINDFVGMPVTASKVNPGNANDRRIRVEGSVFSLGGDSGATWLDAQNKIVGLHFSGTIRPTKIIKEGATIEYDIHTGYGKACYINPVFDFLHLEQNNAIIPSSGSSSGDNLIMPGIPFEIEPEEISTTEGALINIEEALSRTKTGRSLMDDFGLHFNELKYLIHHCRPVTISWYKNKGPAFTAALINAAHDIYSPIKKEINDVVLQQGLRNIYHALLPQASNELNMMLQFNSGLIFKFLNESSSFNEVLKLVEKEDELKPINI